MREGVSLAGGERVGVGGAYPVKEALKVPPPVLPLELSPPPPLGEDPGAEDAPEGDG